MFVNRLAFIVVVGMRPTIRPRQRLCSFIGFESKIERTFLFGLRLLPHCPPQHCPPERYSHLRNR